MNAYLKIGNRLITGDRVIAGLVRYQLLDSFVGQLLMDEVIKSVTLTKQDIVKALTGSEDADRPKNFETFLTQWCQKKGITLDYFNSVILRELRVEKFKQTQFGHKVESEFLHSKVEFDQVEYSLIRVDNLLLAQELYFQLRDDGSDFAQLAEQYSCGRERQTEGRVGPISMASLPAEVADLFRCGQTNVVYGPIPLAKQFWIVRLERITAARLTDSIRSSLIQRLFDRWLQAKVRECNVTSGIVTSEPEPASAEPERSPESAVR